MIGSHSMSDRDVLDVIRHRLFYGSADYTKNQPDLFTPHRFTMLGTSGVTEFLQTINESLTETDILLYVHLPFCFTECLFCNSFPHKTDRHVQNEYLTSLLREIELCSAHGLFRGRRARCIYFGGGTPTSFSNHDLGLILKTLASCIDLSDRCSITSEAHPLTLADGKRVQQLAALGINRLSIGCQTFDQDVLARCNRRNTEDQIATIVRAAHGAGISINVDMMTGLPGQTVDSVRKDLAVLERVRPDSVEYIRHEIVNPLVVKVYRDTPALVVSNDALFEMVCITQEWMSANGYEQNGRFTSDRQWGYRYHWLHEMPIIAFGSRARSYTKTICYDKHEELSTYAAVIRKGLPPIGRYILFTKREQMYRSLLLSLQLQSGLDVERFRSRFSVDPLELFSRLLSELNEYGCLRQDRGSIGLSKYGAYFVEDVCDYIIDTVLKEESNDLIRAPFTQGGGTSARLN
jgi:oxygen-independent coproporphyrinogen-3 oxidase